MLIGEVTTLVVISSKEVTTTNEPVCCINFIRTWVCTFAAMFLPMTATCPLMKDLFPSRSSTLEILLECHRTTTSAWHDILYF